MDMLDFVVVKFVELLEAFSYHGLPVLAGGRKIRHRLTSVDDRMVRITLYRNNFASNPWYAVELVKI